MTKKILTKGHIYLGLFFLVDIWLFSLTGLFLNHPSWSVNDYRGQTQWIESDAQVSVLSQGEPLERARNYMQQLQLRGELLSVREMAEKGQFQFDVHTPGRVVKVAVDLEGGRAKVSRRTTDSFGILNGLHIFTEMERFDPKKEGINWFATRLWVITMDALAVGLIALVLSGFYMLFQTRKKVGGIVSFLAGSTLAILFLLL